MIVMACRNNVRTKIRSSQIKSGDNIIFWRSLQTCKLVENMDVLERHIKAIKNVDILGHLKATTAILEMLMATSQSGDGLLKRVSCISLDKAYNLYLSYANVPNPHLLVKDRNYKQSFKEFICHPKYGLCIYIYENTIILRPDDIDLDKFFILQHANRSAEEAVGSKSPRLDLFENMERILKSLDSEWDRKVMKVVVGAFCTRKELKELGIRNDDIKEMTDSVLCVIAKSEEMVETAEEEVMKKLDNQISRCNEKLSKLQQRMENQALDFTNLQFNEIQDDAND